MYSMFKSLDLHPTELAHTLGAPGDWILAAWSHFSMRSKRSTRVASRFTSRILKTKLGRHFIVKAPALLC